MYHIYREATAFKSKNKRIKIYPVHENFIKPIRSTAKSVGLDLFCLYDIEIPPKQVIMIPLGFKIKIKKGYFGHLKERSSLAIRGVQTLGGIIDADFRSQVMLILINHNKEKICFREKERIAQLLILKYRAFDLELSQHDFKKGERIGGLGSTGK